MIKREIQTFLSAIMFYTRIPVPFQINHSEELLNRATRYFPLMGWIVGGVSGLSFWGGSYIFPFQVGVILSVVVSIMITGAFHEDGFADVCDGFGGGWHKEQVLDIMKDSRIGTYGAAGLFLMLLLKIFTLSSFDPNSLPLIIIAGHSISRFFPVVVIALFPYARDDELSKVKPIGKSIHFIDVLIASVCGLSSLFLLESIFVFVTIVPLFLITILLGFYFKRRIGGFTGDCLGTVQQITEVIFYLILIIGYNNPHLFSGIFI